MSAKLWFSEGYAGSIAGIFNKFRQIRALIFCNFANPGKNDRQFLKTLAYHSPDFD
jgi:hypothetical protein